ncbi:peptidoglycan-binding protein [Microcoleus sp. FACHB-831]|uniref:peptidoglycan-binding domain-containing protein n=1 Tax=Microcoleus sp. FACHB-831 TaxID=2692827 RepID=UPI0016822B6F|nr:peptidoglycan-binding domain-containing protein [Microcoleus sp. FACHB-831]MBD1920832.1 peptidoglycan-binding protein [Microcoleus sp. FACHB-831]
MQSINQTKTETPKMPNLRRGDSGLAVKILQRFLFDRGYQVSNDGIFGKKTEDAVETFQRSCNLLADGLVGPKTWLALASFERDI